MSLLSDSLIAKPEEAARYNTDQDLPDIQRPVQGIDLRRGANLWAMIQNTEVSPEHADAFESVLVVDGGQRLINRFPPEFVAALASLDASTFPPQPPNGFRQASLPTCPAKRHMFCRLSRLFHDCRGLRSRVASHFTFRCASEGMNETPNLSMASSCQKGARQGRLNSLNSIHAPACFVT